MSDRTVAIVKSPGRADPLAEAIRRAGFVPVLVSPFRVDRVEEGERAFDAELVRGAAWIAVTSPHAAATLEMHARMLSKPGAPRVAAVGHGTASVLHAAHVVPAVVGDAGGERLAHRMIAAGLARADRVIHPCAEDSRAELADSLAAAGAVVIPVVVYRMVEDPVGERAGRDLLASGQELAAVIVGSPRLAARAAAIFTRPPGSTPRRPLAIAIGRTTASALRDLGWAPAAVAASPTPADVAAALIAVTTRK